MEQARRSDERRSTSFGGDGDGPGGSAYEGYGGEHSFVDTSILQNEVTQLQFRHRKCLDDNADLEKQLAQAEENLNTVTSQKEILEWRLRQSKITIDNLKEQQNKFKEQLDRELGEVKSLLANCQDKNSIYRQKIGRLEEDYASVCTINDDLNVEIRALKADQTSSKKKIKELTKDLRDELELAEQTRADLLAMFMEVKDKAKDLEDANERLTFENTVLRDRKIELEQQLLERKSSFGLGSLDDSADFEKYNATATSFPPTPRNASLHDEIVAAMGLPSDSKLPNCLYDMDLKDYSPSPPRNTPSGSSNGSEEMLDAGVGAGACACGQREQVGHLKNVLIAMWKTLEATNIVLRNGKSGECEGASIDVDDFSPELENGVFAPGDLETNQDEVVRRIHKELAEFRMQLKQSQELFHTLSNSSQNFGATQSCPRLTDPVAPSTTTKERERSDCSTQTEDLDRQFGSPANTNNYGDRIAQNGDDHEIVKIMGGMGVDGMEESFRLTPNLPTVLEECELEAETSPRNSVRRMNSSEKGSRPPLKRMPKAVTTDDVKSDPEDFQSAASSLPTSTYNSLDRPLSVSGGSGRARNGKGNGAVGQDDDTCSIVSEENTDFWSPITSPSSPTYWTPSQGSSSQETLTNHDAETPVNCDRVDKSFLEETEYSGSKSKVLSWGITMPIDNRHGISSIGVIPESQQEHMKRYAYDTVARSCDRDAEILSRTEWRTLKHDLDAKELAHYKKCFGQEDGGETDDASGGGGAKTSVNMELDDEAEEYCEKYSPLVDELFNCLDVKRDGEEFTEADLPSISQRFEQLATVFKTDHMNLTSRSEATSKCYESALSRMKGISYSLNQCLQRIRDHKLPGEIHEDLRAMEHTSQELEMYSSNLSRAARRAGRIDLETRLCKMIEVMVLYVHILKNLHRNSEEDLQQARQLLGEKGTPLPSRTPIEKLHHNNNNGDTVNRENDEFFDVDENLTERFDDGKPKYALQHLLGPKKSNTGLGNYQELVQAERHSSGNAVFRYASEVSEVVQRELCWPWNWDQTWKGLKQGFSGIIMIIGLLIIADSVIPNVGAHDDGRCDGCESFASRLFSSLGKYGSLTHTQVPHV